MLVIPRTPVRHSQARSVPGHAGFPVRLVSLTRRAAGLFIPLRRRDTCLPTTPHVWSLNDRKHSTGLSQIAVLIALLCLLYLCQCFHNVILLFCVRLMEAIACGGLETNTEFLDVETHGHKHLEQPCPGLDRASNCRMDLFLCARLSGSGYCSSSWQAECLQAFVGCPSISMF